MWAQVMIGAFGVVAAAFLLVGLIWPRRKDDFCVCADCIRCGCGQWWSHHESLDAVTRAHLPFGRIS